MFERYTEQARRALFFARMAVSELGGASIEPSHLLLGLLRERDGGAVRLLESAGVAVDDFRAGLEREIAGGEMRSTSEEVPFSREAKEMLFRAAREADLLLSVTIDEGHLLLAVLAGEWARPPQTLSARTTLAEAVRRGLASPARGQ